MGEILEKKAKAYVQTPPPIVTQSLRKADGARCHSGLADATSSGSSAALPSGDRAVGPPVPPACPGPTPRLFDPTRPVITVNAEEDSSLVGRSSSFLCLISPGSTGLVRSFILRGPPSTGSAARKQGLRENRAWLVPPAAQGLVSGLWWCRVWPAGCVGPWQLTAGEATGGRICMNGGVWNVPPKVEGRRWQSPRGVTSGDVWGPGSQQEDAASGARGVPTSLLSAHPGGAARRGGGRRLHALPCPPQSLEGSLAPAAAPGHRGSLVAAPVAQGGSRLRSTPAAAPPPGALKAAGAGRTRGPLSPRRPSFPSVPYPCPDIS